jgi:hypothetical protein
MSTFSLYIYIYICYYVGMQADATVAPTCIDIIYILHVYLSLCVITICCKCVSTNKYCLCYYWLHERYSEHQDCLHSKGKDVTHFSLSKRRFKCVFMFMVFNATFNNISVILWQSVLLLEETGKNYWPVTSHWQTLSHNVVSSTPRLCRIWTHNVSGDRHWLHR